MILFSELTKLLTSNIGLWQQCGLVRYHGCWRGLHPPLWCGQCSAASAAYVHLPQGHYRYDKEHSLYTGCLPIDTFLLVWKTRMLHLIISELLSLLLLYIYIYILSHALCCFINFAIIYLSLSLSPPLLFFQPPLARMCKRWCRWRKWPRQPWAQPWSRDRCFLHSNLFSISLLYHVLPSLSPGWVDDFISPTPYYLFFLELVLSKDDMLINPSLAATRLKAQSQRIIIMWNLSS